MSSNTTYNSTYYANNKDRVKAQVKAYRAANLERVRLRDIERKYGLAPMTYMAMLVKQGERCRICRREETFDRKGYKRASLSVDHDHETGVVRGLLCMDCNRALGLFRDDPELLEAAASYLRGEFRVAA